MKYRVKFTKTGPVKYTGHLDIMRYFQRAIRRAELPIAYSEGYSPHQILSFAFPLSVGYTSEGEYFDIELTEAVKIEEIATRLNAASTEWVKIVEVSELPEKAGNCMALVYASRYEISFKPALILPEEWEQRYIDYFSQDAIPVSKPKKKGGGYLDIDLKEFIYDFGIAQGRERTVFFTVNSSSSDNVKPTFVADCFLKSIGIEDTEHIYNVHRVEIYMNAGTDEDILLKPLISNE